MCIQYKDGRALGDMSQHLPKSSSIRMFVTRPAAKGSTAMTHVRECVPWPGYILIPAYYAGCTFS